MRSEDKEARGGDEELRKYRELYESAPVGLLSLDPELVITGANLTAEEVLGRGRDALIGSRLTELVAPSSQTAEEHFAHLGRQGGRRIDVLELETEEGEKHTVRLESSRKEDGGFVSAVSDVTGRKLEKGRAEERFRKLVESATVAISLAKDSVITYVNPQYLKLFGYEKEEELVGRHISDLFVPQYYELGKEHYSRIERGLPESLESEFVGIRKDGTPFPFHVAVTRVELDDGASIAGFITDITERKRTEDALKESEAMYRGLFENMQDSVVIFRYVLDDHGDVVDWLIEDANAPVLKYLGRASIDEIKGKRVSQVFDRETLYTEITIVNRVRKSRSPFVMDQHIEPTARDYILTFIPLDEERFIFTATEITERVKAKKRVEREHARLRAIMDTMPVGVAISDASGRIVEVNRITERIWGISAAELEVTAEGFKGLTPEAEKRLREGDLILARAFRGERTINEEQGIERADGTKATILASGSPIKDPQGNVVGAIVTAVDITERKELEKDVAEAKARAEMYLDLLTHDISNYHTAAMGYLQLGEMRLKLAEQERKYITKPLQVLRDSSELIANVRDLQRVEAGKEKREPVDICYMLKEVKEAFENPPGREVKISLDAPESCRVHASVLLRDAFSNIVGNAIKHSTGPVTVNITASTAPGKGAENVMVAIEDTGPGIPDERKKAIFDRSMMGLTKPVSRGLGLYLVKRLVEEYKGSVWVEDRVLGDHTKGARFVMVLPMVSGGAEPSPTDQEGPRPTLFRSGRGRPERSSG